MATQAPPHVHSFLRLRCGHGRNVAVAVCTLHSGAHMWFMVEMDKIRLDGYWYPRDGFIAFHKSSQNRQIRRLLLNLLMATPAFFNPRHTTPRPKCRTGMAVQAGSPHANMPVMREGNRLIGRKLGQEEGGNDSANHHDHQFTSCNLNSGLLP